MHRPTEGKRRAGPERADETREAVTYVTYVQFTGIMSAVSRPGKLLCGNLGAVVVTLLQDLPCSITPTVVH